MAKALIVANWKMNPLSFKEAKKLFDATKKAADAAKSVSIVVAPPSIFLRGLTDSYKGKKLAFAVQNAHFEKEGAFTGDISLSQAKDAGASYGIVGHAERRAAGETNDDARKKVAAALAAKMTPILCVGERDRTGDGAHFSFVAEQLRAGFADVPKGKAARVIVAYEPVWAIGAPKPMSAHDMHEMAIFIRKTVVEALAGDGMKVAILYGGSIDETNAADMMQNGDVSGLLVGRASTDAKKFSALIGAVGKAL